MLFRSHRWDSFTFVTPNWTIRLPGAEYQGDDPDGFLPRAGIIALFEQYLQLHSGEYRNPGALPPGAALVIGSGQSGCQIAEELYQSGRKVFVSVGSAGRAPRPKRGSRAIRKPRAQKAATASTCISSPATV